jgi:hypothetical protein
MKKYHPPAVHGIPNPTFLCPFLIVLCSFPRLPMLATRLASSRRVFCAVLPSLLVRQCAYSTTSPNTSSTVYRGVAFENRCIAAFALMGMQLQRSGGANDHGIDFHGQWSAPACSGQQQQQVFAIIIGQCKLLRSQVGPVHIREFEGALARAILMRAPSQQPQQQQQHSPAVLGVFASGSGFSQAAHTAANISQAAMILCSVDEHGDVIHFKPNPTAQRLLPAHLDIAATHKSVALPPPDNTTSRSQSPPLWKKVVAVTWR